jgi:glycosyltransferase involved in cell wall biosynthesis
VMGLETASTDITYAWDEVRSGETAEVAAGPVRTVFPGRVYEKISPLECQRGLVAVLEELAPDAVAVAGWGTADARVTLRWCRRAGVKAIVMSETREVDGRRVWWKEKLKSLIMRDAHGALVGGRSHREYLVKLGIPAERIRSGYNVVDNAYFAKEAAHWREGAVGGGEAVGGGCSHERERVDGGGREAVSGGCSHERERVDGGEREAVSGGDAVGGGCSHERERVDGGERSVEPLFLASNRFVPRKNLERLVEAYALYCETFTIGLSNRESGSAPPTAHGQPPTAHGQPPTAHGQPPTAHGQPPTAHGQPPTAHGQPPTADLPPSHRPWSLCLLGDGPLWARLIAQCHERGLNVVESAPWENSFPIGATPEHPPTADRPPLSEPRPTAHRPPLSEPRPTEHPPTADRTPGTVYFPGFRQIGELPHFYAASAAFIHPALEEPWGLVINEAMASGLPVLSGDNVGAAEELVEAGRNGWTFDAWDPADIAAAMGRLSGLDEAALREMGLASREILEAKAPTGAFGRGMLEILKL